MSNPNGGGASPVVAVTGRPIIATAYPVTLMDASDIGTRPLLAGAAQPVVFLSASDLDFNGGMYHLQANQDTIPIYVVTDGRPTLAGPAMAVYVIAGSQGVGNRLMLEDGSFLLLEDSSFLLLEV